MTPRKLVRCAVYTRKSSEHNLDLEFNSLDAQREACEAYIKSQVHEGWTLVSDRYDDGGISGGSLNRPDLQRLLADIRSGLIDTVVVYKVDRLTRSLTDFAKLVELFDASQVSFVSITQAFNTTTSMGRLTLNILLSFAQFEREVIGERVRDKIAASKRKGLWMGGTCPLGYVIQNKKLVVVPHDAETVRLIFRRYLELESAGLLLRELRDKGIKTKRREQVTGNFVGGVWFCKGGLTYLLKNPTYIGKVAHRGEIYPADHEPIVAQELFEAVQAKMRSNVHARKLRLRSSPYLLTGLIFDSVGNRMSPSHTLKKGIRYQYYVSQGVLQNREVGEVARVSSQDLETMITAFLHQNFSLEAGMVREVLRSKIQRITVRAATIDVELAVPKNSSSASEVVSHIVSIPWRPKVNRVEKGIAYTPAELADNDVKGREALLAAVGSARAWLRELTDGGTISGIAKRDGRSERQIRILLNLAFLSPSRVGAIRDGSAAIDTITNVARNVPFEWPELAV
ncbi:MAG: recombinase family protein [Alphaproteobacteria bacterium]|nr:recombinase family protein [Alphaproteobacteria bacterium]